MAYFSDSEVSFEEVSDEKDLVEDNDEEGRRINIEENDSTDGEESRRITISFSVVSSVFGNKNDDADTDDKENKPEDSTNEGRI